MKNELSRAYLALAVICIVWGTTYFFMRIGVSTFPPFLFSGIRQTTAGFILLGILKMTGKLSVLNKSNLIRQSIPGVLMIALGNGVVGWSEQYIPSGLAALIVSIMPVYIVLIAFVSGADRKSPNRFILFGLLLGSLGIVLMFRDNLSDLVNPQYFTGMVVAFFAALCWAAGSVFSKYKTAGTNALTSAAIQMLSGGLFLLLASLFLDNYDALDQISNDSIWSLVYLIIFGSLLTYPCFVYALEKLPVGLASIYAYINPFIALLLGFFFLQERLTWLTGVALIAAAGSIYFINRGYKTK
ncbi:DMT family transporter [Gynurincola endophyticus]|jgi:drug/metabolite transporter (DMT)-like permease|uniref:DMT family transporter n=1 Tax=Gynurincola endophyticus TaxID=2479004 RepID=UPI000F8E7E25|nr:EamA family transporter [Gynurincola endophyticus]